MNDVLNENIDNFNEAEWKKKMLKIQMVYNHVRMKFKDYVSDNLDKCRMWDNGNRFHVTKMKDGKLCDLYCEIYKSPHVYHEPVICVNIQTQDQLGYGACDIKPDMTKEYIEKIINYMFNFFE
jgi:hypothetical protein